MKFVLTFITFITFYLENVGLIREMDDEIFRIPLLNEIRYYDDAFNLRNKKGTRNERGPPACDEDKLMMYLAEIQIINPENIINLSALEEITDLCKKVHDSLEKMNKYLATCDPPQQKDLYMQLIKGVKALYQKLCSGGTFQTKFREHYKCYHDLRTDYEECAGPADWIEDDKDYTRLCKEYNDVVNCYYQKTQKLCGSEAADVMKELTLYVINSVLVVKCNEMKLPDELTTTTSKTPTKSSSNTVPEKKTTKPIRILPKLMLHKKPNNQGKNKLKGKTTRKPIKSSSNMVSSSVFSIYLIMHIFFYTRL